MIGAVIKNDIVINVIIIDENQVENLAQAMDVEIIDARPRGLAIGDLRTPQGWTRNADGEQILLPLLDPVHYDSYTVAINRAVEAEKQVELVAEETAEEAMAILTGEVEE